MPHCGDCNFMCSLSQYNLHVQNCNMLSKMTGLHGYMAIHYTDISHRACIPYLFAGHGEQSIQEVRTVKSILIVCLFLVLFVPGALMAQQQSLVQDTQFGWFVAPVLKITGISNQVEAMAGLRGAVLLGKWFSIGLGAYTLISDFKVDVDGTPENLSFTYGGLEQDVIFLSDSLVHGAFRLLMGAGSASLGDAVSVDRFFVAELGGDAEMNVTDWMRISVGGGWRFAQGVSDLEGLINNDLSGLLINFAIKVGRF